MIYVRISLSFVVDNWIFSESLEKIRIFCPKTYFFVCHQNRLKLGSESELITEKYKALVHFPTWYLGFLRILFFRDLSNCTRFPARAVGDPQRPRAFSARGARPRGGRSAPRRRKRLVSAMGVRALQPTREIFPTHPRIPP